MDQILKEYFSGKSLKSKKTLPNEQEIFPYLPDNRLKEVVNLAIALRRPLLIKGEPGSGKTKLAISIAYELFEKELQAGQYKLEDVYFEWHVKSTSKAKDGLYRYDYIERLQHAQLKQINEGELKEEIAYVKRGALGRAFQQTKKLNERVVLLIDEIDKADADFPNDLLRELDEMKYTIEELDDLNLQQESANPEKPPIVIITSNDEKELPPAFLRRCLFFYIHFPSEEQLIEIVKAHFEEQGKDEETIQKIVEDFYKVRKKMERDKDENEKKVSTSELIDWCQILLRHKEEDILELLKGEIPYTTILFKNKEDQIYSKAHLTD